MQIHVVSTGDSIWSIAQAYDVAYQNIIQSNQLSNTEHLVIGQALVIPIMERVIWTQPSQNLWNQSLRNQVPVNQPISSDDWRTTANTFRQKPAVDVGAYIDLQITGAESPQVVDEVGEHLTFLQIFSYKLNFDGSLTPLNDYAVINAAYRNRVVPLMVITNITEEGFSTELATTILANEQLQDRMLNEAIAIMDQKGFLGLDFDLEYLGAENRERYNELMRKARTRLDERGYYLSSALAPQVEPNMQGVLYEGHDYAAHGEIADFVFLMTYEWGWTGGPPRAVAPINEVRRVIEYAASVMSVDKIMMGIPLYGYDWTLPFVEGETRADSIDHQEAIELAVRYNAEIQYDQEAQSPHFNYYDEEGREHEVWFDDARSIQAKFDLVKEFNLRGFYYWVLGWEFPQNWLLIEDNFIVNKRV